MQIIDFTICKGLSPLRLSWFNIILCYGISRLGCEGIPQSLRGNSQAVKAFCHGAVNVVLV